ncbi:nuclear inhibitor of protein phosphatase 1 isoform X2 [Amborella trichopoda]|uniref:FHA domain-containing protein n=1 Tax=Amborella trichopoda TaxID=13333 RepID=U5DAF6_AMBTC|nr:nuclear inhibitor of protein phosphatase 1 isoform X2 [Amborella trichopoda]ERN19190.1 hypothetical protein AMTR_s00061p00180830 [Amborella trichopoda]|eukprot:XP_006857723.1 nuclear inhibitor of protein phosphatase 1 isoform X2 [Amborella trichopoda]
MYGRTGLDRFKKAQTIEPFSVTLNNSVTKPATQPLISSSKPQVSQSQSQNQQQNVRPKPNGSEGAQVTSVGGGQSNWQPPDWAIEPRPGVYYLEVMKDGEILDKISLDKRRHIFGRQYASCDFVLDHPSVSRQHAAVVPHKNGSIYVIDLGSVHGTFVANERLTKDNPVELEAGQSLRFAASTRSYILRKNTAALFPTPSLATEFVPPSPPDPSDEDAVLAYNTILNRHGAIKPGLSSKSSSTREDGEKVERSSKRLRKTRVAFRDQVGGNLVEVVGISDGQDVGTEPGPVGVKEGSLVGKYESLVQVTVIPKGQEPHSPKDGGSKGVTDKLQQVLNKVKTATKVGIYDDLYGDSFAGKVGSSWANLSGPNGLNLESEGKSPGGFEKKQDTISTYDDDDDLFGDND